MLEVEGRHQISLRNADFQHLRQPLLSLFTYICFYLADLIVDRALDLRYVGGIYAGNVKPTPFLCLALKMLQIQPEKDIIIEFIQQEQSK